MLTNRQILSNTEYVVVNEGKAENIKGLYSTLQAKAKALKLQLYLVLDFPGGSDSKVSCVQCGRRGFNPLVGEIPWRRKWQPTPVLLPRKSHGRRSLVQTIVHGVTESDTAEQLLSLSLGVKRCCCCC